LPPILTLFPYTTLFRSPTFRRNLWGPISRPHCRPLHPQRIPLSTPRLDLWPRLTKPCCLTSVLPAACFALTRSTQRSQSPKVLRDRKSTRLNSSHQIIS